MNLRPYGLGEDFCFYEVNMSFFNDLVSDFRFNLFRDVTTTDILLVSLLIIPLIVTFLSQRIAQKFKKEEKEIVSLSLKIKTVSLIVVAAIAVLITQI